MVESTHARAQREVSFSFLHQSDAISAWWSRPLVSGGCEASQGPGSQTVGGCGTRSTIERRRATPPKRLCNRGDLRRLTWASRARCSCNRMGNLIHPVHTASPWMHGNARPIYRRVEALPWQRKDVNSLPSLAPDNNAGIFFFFPPHPELTVGDGA